MTDILLMMMFIEVIAIVIMLSIIAFFFDFQAIKKPIYVIMSALAITAIGYVISL